jgi:glucan biosynthesis protein C
MAQVTTTGRRASKSRRGLIAPVESAKGPDASRPRYHAFDALRGMAMFLVIGLHAALGYVKHDIKGVLWCVRDSPTLPAFDWFCWWSMGVSNPLYFTIAGFFAVMLYDSKGVRGFLANRGRRVLVPFLVASVTILPASMAAWAYGWIVSGRVTWSEVRHIRFRDPLIQSERLGSGHLWFLEYLVAMLLVYATIRWIFERKGIGLARLRRFAGRVIGSPWAPLLLAIPTTALLWISRERVGVDAILDRRNSFLIDPVKLLHHAAFFLAGVGLYGLRHDLARVARPAPWFLALAIPAFVGRAWFIGQDQAATLQGVSALMLVAFGALFSWLMVFGAIGTAHRVCRESSPTLSYLADSSYWIYLVHMPILGLIEGDLYLVSGHALWKAPVVLFVTLAIGFGSYQCLVRHTALGAGLHGRRTRAEA